MDALEVSAGSSTGTAWVALLAGVHAEIAEAVEKTVEYTRTAPSFRNVDEDAIREVVRGNYEAVLSSLEERRRPHAGDDGAVFDAAGETRARQGVDLVEMLAGFRLSLEYLHELAGRVAAAGPEREALLLEFLELASSWADFAMLNAANGHRRGELSVAREHQHVQTNLVRRVLTGTAAPAEIRSAVTPLGLDPAGRYHAIRARPEPSVDMEAIERYVGADGLVRRGNGLLALIDGDACGFVGSLPQRAAPIAVGVSEPVELVAMESAFRQAGRALETALALGVKGIFSFNDLSIQSAIAGDDDLGAVLVARYVHSVLAVPAGLAILDTAERYLANDRSVDLTAKDVDVHPNTVRHRLERFEEITGRSLRETETLVELWWALQRRRLG
jgi:PucR C-terminal helix-turn-helix domain